MFFVEFSTRIGLKFKQYSFSKETCHESLSAEIKYIHVLCEINCVNTFLDINNFLFKTTTRTSPHSNSEIRTSVLNVVHNIHVSPNNRVLCCRYFVIKATFHLEHYHRQLMCNLA